MNSLKAVYCCCEYNEKDLLTIIGDKVMGVGSLTLSTFFSVRGLPVFTNLLELHEPAFTNQF